MNKELSKEEILDYHLEVWDRSTEDCIDELEQAMQQYADQEKRELEKENKELQEKITNLETVISKLSHKIILYESNY